MMTFLYLYTKSGFMPNDDASSEMDKDNSEFIQKFQSDGHVFYYPWQNDLKCKHYPTRLGQNLNLTYLVSFPRSGNTWLRYLIEGASGLFTSSIYKDERILPYGFLGEDEPHDNGKTIVTKSHGIAMWNNSFENRIKDVSSETTVILLIRHPIKSILSYWNVIKSSGTKISDYFRVVNISSYNSSEFRKYVEERIELWTKVYEDRLIWSKNLLIVFYEDLESNPIFELKKVIHFLKLKIVEGRMDCLLRNLEGPFKRKQQIQPINPFTTTERIKMAYSLTRILSLAKAHGITSIPKDYTYFIEKYTHV